MTLPVYFKRFHYNYQEFFHFVSELHHSQQFGESKFTGTSCRSEQLFIMCRTCRAPPLVKDRIQDNIIRIQVLNSFSWNRKHTKISSANQCLGSHY